MHYKNEYMQPTLPFLQEKFNYFNHLCFNGELPTPVIRLTKARTFGGKLTWTAKKGLFKKGWHSPVISISTLFDIPENEIEDILLHEMIHFCILVRKIKDTSPHGKEFRNMMEQINLRHGRHITVSLRHTERQTALDTSQRRHLVCVVQLNKGITGITVSAQSRIFDLWAEINGHPEVSNARWYVTTDPYFNRFPRSRTLKIYKANPQELTTHLAGALRLRNDGHTIQPVTNNTK